MVDDHSYEPTVLELAFLKHTGINPRLLEADSATIRPAGPFSYMVSMTATVILPKDLLLEWDPEYLDYLKPRTVEDAFKEVADALDDLSFGVGEKP